jgi:hypothetical protein
MANSDTPKKAVKAVKVARMKDEEINMFSLHDKLVTILDAESNMDRDGLIARLMRLINTLKKVDVWKTIDMFDLSADEFQPLSDVECDFDKIFSEIKALRMRPQPLADGVDKGLISSVNKFDRILTSMKSMTHADRISILAEQKIAKADALSRKRALDEEAHKEKTLKLFKKLRQEDHIVEFLKEEAKVAAVAVAEGQ